MLPLKIALACVVVLLWPESANSFRRLLFTTPVARQQTSIHSTWSEGAFGQSSLPIISSSVINILDQAVGTFLTAAAIKTCGYYMLEFHDEVSYNWMTSYRNYSSMGFINGDWQTYLDQMIREEPQQIDVTLHNSRRTRSRINSAKQQKDVTKTELHYYHDIEPRNVAHRIIAIREDLANELTQDLGSIKLENAEAVKYAKIWLGSGKDTAEQNRAETRSYDEEGASTPYRDQNYFDATLLITNIAIDLVKVELERRQDTPAIAALDSVLERLDVQNTEENGKQLDQVIHKMRGPRTLIEELCYIGLKDGVDFDSENVGGKAKSSLLKLSQALMDTRWALALEMCKVLRTQSILGRRFYKDIKTFGGFSHYDQTRRSEVFLVNTTVSSSPLLPISFGTLKRAPAKSYKPRPMSNVMLAEKARSEAESTYNVGQSKAATHTDQMVEDHDGDDDSGIFGPMMM